MKHSRAVNHTLQALLASLFLIKGIIISLVLYLSNESHKKRREGVIITMSKSSVEPSPKPDPRKVLFNEAMNRNWDKVKDLYKNNEEVQGKHITRANDTLLHVAVSSAPEKIVLKLLDIVKLNKGITTLYLRKNTNMLYI